MPRDQVTDRSDEISVALSRVALDDFPSPLPTHLPLYRPLLDSEIRLIKLGPGDWTDPISCELIHVSLDSRPKYVALSYAWGNATETRPITLNDNSYNITTSLYRGLRRLRFMVSEVDENPESFISEKCETFTSGRMRFVSINKTRLRKTTRFLGWGMFTPMRIEFVLG
jgi:hypothetical protein